MGRDFLGLVEDSKSLNSKVFSLVRLELLSFLNDLNEDGATYRELKATMSNTSDGNLYANLKALIEMGYLTSEKVAFEQKTLELYKITPEGKETWLRTKVWLCRFLECKV